MNRKLIKKRFYSQLHPISFIDKKGIFTFVLLIFLVLHMTGQSWIQASNQMNKNTKSDLMNSLSMSGKKLILFIKINCQCKSELGDDILHDVKCVCLVILFQMYRCKKVTPSSFSRLYMSLTPEMNLIILVLIDVLKKSLKIDTHRQHRSQE